MWNSHGDNLSELVYKTASRHVRRFRILFSRTVRKLIMRRKQLIFFQLKHQLSSCQHPGHLTVQIWIRLIIKSGWYFRSKCTRWRLTMLMSCAVPVYPDCMGWTWPAYYWQGDQAVVHPSKSLRWDQSWPLLAQTLKTSSEWSSAWMFLIL